MKALKYPKFINKKGDGKVLLRNASIYMGGVILLFASVVFWQSLQFEYYNEKGPGPGFFPLWLSGGLALFSIIYIGTSIKKEVILISDIIPKGKDLGNILTLLIGAIIFLLIINYMGFVLAASLLLFSILRRFYKWYVGIGISVGVSVCLFYLFHTLLGIPLPVNFLGW
jgi:putative tricarboxylic transport membrane protein